MQKEDGKVFDIALKDIVGGGEEWEINFVGRLLTKLENVEGKDAKVLFGEASGEKDEELEKAARDWVGGVKERLLKPVSGVIADPEES